MTKNKRVAAVAAIGVSTLLLAACGGGSGGSSSQAAAGSTSAKGTGATGSAEVFSWWTSGSESAALQQLFDATKAANPDLKLVNAAVAGGAGTNAQQVLATRLAGGDVPETWQTHAGGALGDYVKQDVVADLTDLYTSNGWDKVVPKTLLDSITYDGKIYAVITGVHRNNVWWYNKKVLSSAGVDVPASMTFSQFQDIASKLKAKGVAPVCLGDTAIWTAATVVEDTVIGEVGAQGWNDLMAGSLKWSDPKVVQAVKDAYTTIGWAQPDHKSQDWTGAVAELAQGKCAFNIMGDWAYGELVVKQKLTDGTDFGYTVLGDPNTFVTVSDAFVEGKGSKNPAGAAAYLTAVMSKDAQVNFNKRKGSAPFRTDVDTSSLGAYQQQAAKTLASGSLVPSLVQGAPRLPAAIGQAFSDATTLLEANGDAMAFAKAMDTAFASNQ
ncbi:MAG: ABC transporter substrate-binding protein [Motilibacteraceae bacterium]